MEQNHSTSDPRPPGWCKVKEEGIYASFIAIGMSSTRSDQGLTISPKIHQETLLDNGTPRQEPVSMDPISKGPSLKDPVVETHDPQLMDGLSLENAIDIEVDTTNETRIRTGTVYHPCQHIGPLSHQRCNILTGAELDHPLLGQNGRPFLSSQASDHGLEPVPEHCLAKFQSAPCQINIDEMAVNLFQLAKSSGDVSRVCPMDWTTRPVSPSSAQDTERRTKDPSDSDVEYLWSRECRDAVDQPVAKKNLAILPTINVDESAGDRGHKLTSPSDCMAETWSRWNLNGVTIGSFVDESDMIDVTSRLYGPIYKPQTLDASTQLNTAIPTTIRKGPTTGHISATQTHQQKSLSTLCSSPSLLSLRSRIATAPMASSEVREIQQLILAAMDGEIELERNPTFEAPLEAIYGKMVVDEQFRKGVVAFAISKLGYNITENEADLLNESCNAELEATTTAPDASSPKFSVKRCTYDELMTEYKATRALSRKQQRSLLHYISRCTSLAEKTKTLEFERDHWKTISTKVPGTKAKLVNYSTKWQCPCGILNDSWADTTEWAPRKTPRERRPCSEDAGIPAGNVFEWAQTNYCRFCGRQRLGLDDFEDTEEGGDDVNNVDHVKGHCQNGDPKYNTLERVVPKPQTFAAHPIEFTSSDNDAQLPQSPLDIQDIDNMQPDQTDGYDFSDLYFGDAGTDQEYLLDLDDTIVDLQVLSGVNCAIADQRYICGNTIADQHYIPDNTIAGQHDIPGNTIAHHQNLPIVIGTTTGRFDSLGFLFDAFGDSLVDNQNSLSIENWFDDASLPNTNSVMSTESETPSSLSSDETLCHIKSEAHSSIEYDRGASEEIDTLLHISEADLNIINSIGNEQAPRLPAKAAPKPLKCALGNPKQSQSGMTYDIRGNQISTANFTSAPHYNHMAPSVTAYQSEVASSEPLTFPATFSPKPSPEPNAN